MSKSMTRKVFAVCLSVVLALTMMPGNMDTIISGAKIAFAEDVASVTGGAPVPSSTDGTTGANGATNTTNPQPAAGDTSASNSADTTSNDSAANSGNSTSSASTAETSNSSNAAPDAANMDNGATANTATDANSTSADKDAPVARSLARSLATAAESLPTEITVDDFLINTETNTIISYLGDASELTIPASVEYEGQTVEIKHIGDKAFASLGTPLTKVTISEGIESIGAQSFAANTFTTLTIPDSMKEIGESAFESMSIETLTFADAPVIETIGKNAFKDNEISTLDLSKAVKLTTIAEGAFERNTLTDLKLPEAQRDPAAEPVLATIETRAFNGNDLTEVALPASLTEVASGAFTENGRYVVLTGEVTSGANFTDIVYGEFGALHNPVDIWVKGEDKDSRATVLSPLNLTNNVNEETSAENVLVAGKHLVRQAPSIDKYLAPQIDVELTPEFLAQNSEQNPLVLLYEPMTAKPTFTGIAPLNVELNAENVNVLEGVKATDGLGNDITSKIIANPTTVDTSQKGQHEILLEVTDSAGNTAKVTRLVLVGLDPNEIETGNGWVMGDFTYAKNSDGTSRVTGFSTQGTQKLNAGNKFVSLPRFNPNDPERSPITTIGDYAFNSKGLQSVDIPDTVTTIGAMAFNNNELTYVDLPESITTIKDNAFKVNRLSSVTIPEGVTDISYGAFRENAITSVTLPESLRTIGSDAFAYNRLSSVELPQKLTQIYSSAFSFNNLTAVQIPDSVTSIGARAFERNEIGVVNFGKSLTTIGDHAFEYNKLTETIIPDGVNNLGTYAFAHNQISNYKLPAGITAIPDGFFKDNRIIQADIPDTVTSIGDEAFAQNNIVDLNVPGSVKTIGNYAFYENWDLTNLQFNEGLESIGNYAFRSTGLHIDTLAFPSTMKSIGDYAFSGSNKNMWISHVVLPDSVTSVGNYAFEYLDMETVKLSEGLTQINTGAFRYNALTEVTIPDAVTEIQNNAFYNNRLDRIHLSNNLLKIGDYAFASNADLNEIEFPDTLTRIGDSAFQDDKLFEVGLPESLTSIGSSAFWNNKICHVYVKGHEQDPDNRFPDALTYLGSSAFRTNNLSGTLYTPKNVSTINSSTFSTNDLTNVVFSDAVTTIGTSAFTDNRIGAGGSPVVIPANITSISSSAFQRNQIHELSFANPKTKLSTYVFADNKTLTHVDLPSELTEIPDYAFSQDNLAGTLTIPATVKTIGSNAFENNQITGLTIARNTDGTSALSGISANAFKSNAIQKPVYVPSTLLASGINSNAFTDNPPLRTEGTDLALPRVFVYPTNAEGELMPEAPASQKNSFSYNQGIAVYQFVDADTNKPISTPIVRYGTIGTTDTGFNPPSDEYYERVTPGPVNATYGSGETPVLVPFRQIKQLDPQAVQITLQHSDSRGSQKGYGLTTDDDGYLRFELNASGLTENIEGAEVVINFNNPTGEVGNYITPDLNSFPSNIKERFDISFENGELHLKFKQPVTPAYSINFMFRVSRDRNSIPNNMVLDLTGQTSLRKDGRILTTTDPTKKLGKRYTPYNPTFSWGTPDHGKQIGTAEFVNGTKYISRTENNPVEYTLSVNGGSDKRLYNHVHLEMPIPTYSGIDAEGATSSNLKAVFVPELSKGWTLSDDGTKVIYDADIEPSYRPNIPSVFYKYPGMHNGSSSHISGKLSFTPEYGKGDTLQGTTTEANNKFTESPVNWEDAPIESYSDTDYAMYYAYEDTVTTTPPPHNIPAVSAGIYQRNTATRGSTSSSQIPEQSQNRLSSYYSYNNTQGDLTGSYPGYSYLNISKSSVLSGTGSHYADGFMDTPDERNHEFIWTGSVGGRGGYFKDMTFQSYGLDSRMRYTSVQTPADMGPATVKIYAGVSGSKPVGDPIYEIRSFGDKINLPKEISEQAAYIDIAFDDMLPGNKSNITTYKAIAIGSRLREPDQAQFNPDGANSYGVSEKNKYYNRMMFSYMPATSEGEELQTSRLSASDASEYIVVLPDEPYHSSNKSFVNNTDSSRNFGRLEQVSYNLSTTTKVYREDELVEGFKLVDLLPFGLQPVSAEPNSGFVNIATNFRAQWVANYENTGCWAYVVEADALDLPRSGSYWMYNGIVAKITALTSPSIETGKYTNKLWTSIKGEGYWSKEDSSKANTPGESFKDFARVAYSERTIQVNPINELNAYHQVKSSTDPDWSSTGTKLKPGQEFAYKLLISNTLSDPQPNLTVVHVLPYNGDVRMVVNQQGEYPPRNTQLTGLDQEGVTFVGKVSMTGPASFVEPGTEPTAETEDLAGKYTFYYSKADPNTAFKKQEVRGGTAAHYTGYSEDSSLWMSADQVGDDWASVTAIKVVANDGTAVPARSGLSIYVPMVAPTYNNQELDGKRAVSSFTRMISSVPNETNEVYVEMTGKQVDFKAYKVGVNVKFQKNEETGAYDKVKEKTPLPGAKYQLFKVYQPKRDGELASVTKKTAADGTEYTVLDSPVTVGEGSTAKSTVTTDADGIADFGPLMIGRDYILEETGVPEGYEVNAKEGDERITLITSDELNALNDGETLTRELTNTKIQNQQPITPATMNFTFTKVDAYNNPLPYVTFKLQGTSATGQTYTYTAMSSITGKVEFKDVHVLGKVPAADTGLGKPYVLTETGPRGVLTPINPITVTTTMMKDENGVSQITPLFDNGPVTPFIHNNRASITVVNLGIYNLDDQKKLESQLTKDSGRRLTEVPFEVEDEEGHVIKDGITTDASGQFVINNVEVGKTYYVVQKEVPENFKPYTNKDRGDNKLKVSVDAVGRVEVNGRSTSMHYAVYPNSPIYNTNRIDIAKSSTKDGSVLQGAEFGLFRIDTNGSQETATLVDKQVTDAHGQATFENFGMDLSEPNYPRYLNQTFEVRETKAPLGYDNDFVPVRIVTDTQKITYKSIDVTDNPISVRVKKVDAATGKVLSGARFGIYEGATAAGDPIATATSGNDGIAVFDSTAGVTFDNTKLYSIKELDAPFGYRVSTDIYRVDLPGYHNRAGFNGEVNITVKNEVVKSALEVKKIDERTLAPLSGVTFTLVDTTTGDAKEADRVLKTGPTGLATFTGLIPGKVYELTETAGLPGYNVDKTPRRITVQPGKTTAIAIMNTREATSFTLTKMGVLNSEHAGEEVNVPLKGVTFSIERLVGTQTYIDKKVLVTNERGHVVFSGLTIGSTYRVREVSTADAAPSTERGLTKGWARNTDTFELKVTDNPDNPLKPIVTMRNVTKNTDVTDATVYDYPNPADTVSVSATKAFEGGDALDPAPTYTAVLSQYQGDTQVADFSEESNLTRGTDGVLKASFSNLPMQYFDTDTQAYKNYRYEVSEKINGEAVDADGVVIFAGDAAKGTFTNVVSAGADNESSLTSKSFAITNTFTTSTKDVTATKTWVDGPDTHPTVYFKLYRSVPGGSVEAVPNAEVKALENGTTEVTWSDMPVTDAAGKVYTYSVKETDAQGVDTTPENYVKTENGLTVTNAYQIPTNASAKATKTWVNGPENARPTIYFQLYRAIAGGEPEVVPSVDVKELSQGTTEVAWTNLEKTDINGNAYTFSVKEVNAEGNDFTPTNYTKVEDGLSVTNTYVIPTDGVVTAKKTWVNGADTHSTVYFTLYRNIAGGTPEIVPDVPVAELTSGIESYTWDQLETTDVLGHPYVFTVHETDADSTDAVPEHYEATYSDDHLAVTNTYVVPTTEITGTKVWVDGQMVRPVTYFALERTIEGGVPEVLKDTVREVPSADTDTAQVVWQNVPTTTDKAVPINYKIVEVDAGGTPVTELSVSAAGNEGVQATFTPTTSDDGMTITNTYVVPTTEITATKAWVDGPAEHPTVYFTLYRSIGDGEPEAVPGAEVKELANGVESITWSDIDATDSEGNAYTFSVHESDAEGSDAVPEHFEATYNDSGLGVTNAYVVPTTDITGTKVWVDGQSVRPVVYFALERTIEGQAPEILTDTVREVPATEGESAEVVWEQMPTTTSDATPISYEVVEVDATGTPVMEMSVIAASNDRVQTKFVSEASEDGMTITNTYVMPMTEVTATKTWVDGPDEHPAAYLTLYRAVAGAEPEVVPGAEVKALSADQRTETVTWTELEATNAAGEAYSFSVHETDKDGQDFTPENYEATYSDDGLAVTNTYVSPLREVTGEKVWDDSALKGVEVTHPTIYLKLFRAVADAEPEAVPDVELGKLENGVTKYTWTDLPEKNTAGEEYIYTVREADAEGHTGEVAVPEGYTLMSEEGLVVTNKANELPTPPVPDEEPTATEPEVLAKTGDYLEGASLIGVLAAGAVAVLVVARRRSRDEAREQR